MDVSHRGLSSIYRNGLNFDEKPWFELTYNNEVEFGYENKLELDIDTEFEF